MQTRSDAGIVKVIRLCGLGGHVCAQPHINRGRRVFIFPLLWHAVLLCYCASSMVNDTLVNLVYGALASTGSQTSSPGQHFM